MNESGIEAMRRERRENDEKKYLHLDNLLTESWRAQEESKVQARYSTLIL